MIDWYILNFINKSKYKSILLIVNNAEEIKKYVSNSLITVVEEKNFIEHYTENAYHIIATWDTLLSEGPANNIYMYLAKLNHLLRDDGIIMCRTVSSVSHYTDMYKSPFCWNIQRINSIGKCKGLRISGTPQEILSYKNKTKYLRFNYVPDI